MKAQALYSAVWLRGRVASTRGARIISAREAKHKLGNRVILTMYITIATGSAVSADRYYMLTQGLWLISITGFGTKGELPLRIQLPQTVLYLNLA